jgi:predicted nucleotidyltransferase
MSFTGHGLTERHMAIIRDILTPYAAVITRVDLFGSHAMGNYRPNSDIDMVLHGPVDWQTVNRISGEFEDSSLPMKVDVLSYDQLTHQPLKAHIDLVAKTLLTQAELRLTIS